MHQRIVISLLLVLVLTITGCQKSINGFECKLEKGSFWHDVYLTNKSGEDLHEVRVTLTLFGEKGGPRSEDRYYVLWPHGQTLKSSLSVENSPLNVQKVSLAGSCTEGMIEAEWINP